MSFYSAQKVTTLDSRNQEATVFYFYTIREFEGLQLVFWSLQFTRTSLGEQVTQDRVLITIPPIKSIEEEQEGKFVRTKQCT